MPPSLMCVGIIIQKLASPHEGGQMFGQLYQGQEAVGFTEVLVTRDELECGRYWQQLKQRWRRINFNVFFF